MAHHALHSQSMAAGWPGLESVSSKPRSVVDECMVGRQDELFSPTWSTKGCLSAQSSCDIFHAHVKNAQGSELLYPTFNSRQSAMLFEETLRISCGRKVNTLTATAMRSATLSSRLSFTTNTVQLLKVAGTLRLPQPWTSIAFRVRADGTRSVPATFLNGIAFTTSER